MKIQTTLLSAFVASMTLALPGCSYQCKFEVRGTIRDAVTGLPISNVQIEIVDDSRSLTEAVQTNADGHFEIEFTTTPTGQEVLTGWKLILKADGYESETVQIGPVKEPKMGKGPGYLVFHVTLRKAK